VLRNLAHRTAKQQAIKLEAPGPISLGGGGIGEVDAIALVAFAKEGPLALSASDQALRTSELRKLLRDVPTSPNGVKASDLLITAKTALEVDHRLVKGIPTQKPIFFERKFIKRQLHSRRRRAKLKIKECGGVVSAIRDIAESQPYFLFNRRMLNSVLHKVRAKSYTRAAKILQKSWNKTLDPVEAEKALRTSVPEYEPQLSLETLEPIPVEWSSSTAS
jgi:hypothetical protein